ncbi:unnamed protein product [Owenia fusiformis]|uniref:Cuticlin N-terminal domain-containing protein n=1 Tax=Owenia fusiformis TaxID=6347 RepID=A0A8J1XVZ2_OWEFU|nr:unnamed protein product [Owenia fusiformis]
MMGGNLVTLLLVLVSHFRLAEGGLGTSCLDYGVQDPATCDVPDSYCGPQGECICIGGFAANSGNTACETYFNCLNEGCRHGTCNFTTGACQCPGDKVGFDCTVSVDSGGGFISDLTTAGCEICNKTGTFACSPDSLCECKYGYTGETCSDERVRVEVCDANSMIVSLEPYSLESVVPVFNGSMYIHGKTHKSNCNINVIQSDFVQTTPDLLLNDCVIGKEDDNGDIHFYVDIVVQFHKDYVTSHDIIHRVSCIHLANSVFSVSHVTSVNPPRDLARGGNIFDTKSVIGMQIEGTTIKDPDTFQLGAELTVTFTLLNTQVFRAFMVTELKTMSSGGPGLLSKMLLNERCPDEDAYDVLQPNPIDVSGYDVNHLADKNVIRIKIFAHKFANTDSVLVTGVAQACFEMSECIFPIDCPATTTRKKRSTLENTVGFELEKMIKVIDRDTRNDENGRLDVSGGGGKVMTSQCRSSWEYIATLTIMASLLFLSNVVLIIFCFCARRRRRLEQRNAKRVAEKPNYRLNEMIPGIRHQSSMSNPSYE